MKHEDLKPGDFLFLANINNSFSNIAIVSSKRNNAGEPYVFHFRGFEPYALVENLLPSQEFMKERGKEFHVLRLNDKTIIDSYLKQLQTWHDVHSPYSFNPMWKAIRAFQEYIPADNMDIYNKIFDARTRLDEKQRLYFVLLSILQELPEVKDAILLKTEENFDIEKVVKYACRQNTIPKLPLDDKGFGCLQGLLIALQVTYIKDQVKPRDMWITRGEIGKNTVDYLYDLSELEEFESSIPDELKLDASICSVESLYISMKRGSICSDLGVLESCPDREGYNQEFEEQKKLAIELQKPKLEAAKPIAIKMLKLAKQEFEEVLKI